MWLSKESNGKSFTGIFTLKQRIKVQSFQLIFWKILYPYFRQIKTFGGALAPISTQLLHHCEPSHKKADRVTTSVTVASPCSLERAKLSSLPEWVRSASLVIIAQFKHLHERIWRKTKGVKSSRCLSLCWLSNCTLVLRLIYPRRKID